MCSLCIRACDETRCTFSLTIDAMGFDSRIVAGQNNTVLESDCVSCGACLQACPKSALTEKSVIEMGQAEHSILTTCAYCGVGCTFKAEMKGDQVVRMMPWKDGQANRGHSCDKGRFAWGYATHKDRILNPMIRKSTSDPWREVSWDEAISYAALCLKKKTGKHDRDYKIGREHA